MTLATYTPALGQQSLVDDSLELLLDNAVMRETSFHIIDNASKEPIVSPFAHIIRNEENKGMVGTLRQAREHCTADILVMLHSDLFLFESGWDKRLVDAFESDPKLSLLGVVGATIASSNGGREDVYCAFRDWENHGKKAPRGVTPVALLDGCFLAARVSALKELNLPDLSYPSHHFYDKDLSLSMTMESHRVGVIDLECSHLSGQTSCQPEYQKWAKERHGGDDEIYRRAESRYLEKWRSCFPVKVTSKYVVHVSFRHNDTSRQR